MSRQFLGAPCRDDLGLPAIGSAHRFAAAVALLLPSVAAMRLSPAVGGHSLGDRVPSAS